MNSIVAKTIILIYSLKAVSCFITRLPKCKYSANFTLIQDGKFFRGIKGNSIPGPVTRDQCSAYCLSDDTCVFYNHKLDESVCELQTTHIGQVVDDSEWRFASTNYSDYWYRGPFCQFLKPKCALQFRLQVRYLLICLFIACPFRVVLSSV